MGGLIDAHPVYYNLRWLIYYLISLLWDENFILHLYIFVPDINCLVLCPAVHTPRQRSSGGLIWIFCYKGVSGKRIIIMPRMQFNKTTTHPPLGGVDGQVWGDELHGLAVRVELSNFMFGLGPCHYFWLYDTTETSSELTRKILLACYEGTHTDNTYSTRTNQFRREYAMVTWGLWFTVTVLAYPQVPPFDQGYLAFPGPKRRRRRSHQATVYTIQYLVPKPEVKCLLCNISHAYNWSSSSSSLGLGRLSTH